MVVLAEVVEESVTNLEVVVEEVRLMEEVAVLGEAEEEEVGLYGMP